MKVLKGSQQISHCKSMQIFYDTQGKFTPQSEVGSTLSSNSSKILWFKNEEDPIKNEGAWVVTTLSINF